MEKPELLLVEDEILIQEILLAAFDDTGFEVFAVRHGKQAIAALDSNAAGFRTVITDIRLPGRLDGWDVARHARKLVADMSIVYITGDRAHDWSSNGVPDSVVLMKPFAPAQVTTAISTLIIAVDTRRAGS
jgi:DNA-binding response OmpR family regulator